MAKPFAAGASEAHVALAARHALERGANAVDAVLGAVLVAAAESPSVFLGPLQVLVAGGGAGLLAIDGRVRQPGLGVPRPRGIVAGEEPPFPARVAVPGLPFAVAAAHAALGGMSLSAVAAAAVAGVRPASPERGAVLDLFARRGTSALLDDSFVVEALAAAGRAAGGSLTRDDLAAVRPSVIAQDEQRLNAGILHLPWKTPEGVDASNTHVVAAADPRGLAAAACYESPRTGMPMVTLGLVAPLLAAPVRRGEPRVRPGEPRPAAGPIALRFRRGVADLAVGVAQAPDADAILAGLIQALETAPTFSDALSTVPAGRVVALARPAELPVVVRSA